MIQANPSGSSVQTITLVNDSVWEVTYDPVLAYIPAGIDPSLVSRMQLQRLSNGTLVQRLPLDTGQEVTVVTDWLQPTVPAGLPADAIERVTLWMLGNATGLQQVFLSNGSVLRSIIAPVVPVLQGNGMCFHGWMDGWFKCLWPFHRRIQPPASSTRGSAARHPGAQGTWHDCADCCLQRGEGIVCDCLCQPSVLYLCSKCYVSYAG